ncbi:MAG: hypothetical protein EA398_16655 [Deltaproteobacteria bacterium]|nr:MAG: hypothetical protein EA398_16655 [Deltaproteobacteria bacterium]
MRILVWATTFGADLWSLVRHLDANGRHDIRVVMKEPDTFLREGVSTLFPLRAPILARRPWHHAVGLPGFRPDVTVMDNRLPLRAPSRHGFMLWHGYGWKGPQDRKEFALVHRQIRRLWGDPAAPGARFRWQCFGPHDRAHRTEVSGFHPDTCLALGAASHDHLRQPLDRQRAQPFYPFDVVRRPTVLIAPTWHYGEIFAHWGTDAELLDRLLHHLGHRGCNVILRLHDSYRFPPEYRAFLDRMQREHPHVLLKYKDRNPDNFLDLQVADVLLSNFSSIATLFYATGRPSIHIYPVRDADEAFLLRQYTLAGVREVEVPSARFIWKRPPEENGGLLARSPEEMMALLDQALDDPDCCREPARRFLDEHMLGADGHACARIEQALADLVATPA